MSVIWLYLTVFSKAFFCWKLHYKFKRNKKALETRQDIKLILLYAVTPSSWECCCYATTYLNWDVLCFKKACIKKTDLTQLVFAKHTSSISVELFSWIGWMVLSGFWFFSNKEVKEKVSKLVSKKTGTKNHIYCTKISNNSVLSSQTPL